ncbi:MAG TPA: hypothetical protein VJV05_11645 [Pyrinomonadaceae bacterium]|nr:hypothetical protein [Pyrinomonadaceae bacterium]
MIDRMGSFVKTNNCPSSERLLAFRFDEVAEPARIERHLELCEFCAAEVGFYRKYPPVEEVVEPGPIPEPLRQLADALLQKRSDLSPLYTLLTD